MNEQTQTLGNPLGTEPIGKLIRRFGIPCVISLLVNALYNIVDQIFIGWGVGYLGNAATNVAFPMVTLALSLALLIGDGCAANMSLKLGAKDPEGARRGVGNAVTLMVIVSIVLLVLGEIFLTPLLQIFGATDKVMPYAQEYTSIILIGLPFVIVGTGLNTTVRADGSPKYAMVSMLIGAAINTVLDPLFIFTFHMGVAGAAWATILGQIATFAFSVAYIRKFKNFKFSAKLMRLNAKSCKAVLSLGVSSFITQMAIVVVQIVVNNSARYYGAMTEYGSEIPLSCLGIVMKVNQILISIILGIGVGSQPILGFNYGAKNYERVKKAYKMAVFIASCVAVVGFAVFQLFPQTVITVFGQENELYNDFAQQCFRIYLFCVFVIGFQITSSIYFQATGRPVRAAILSLSRMILFLVPLMLILPLFMGLSGILYAGPIADGMAGILAAIFIFFEMKSLKKKEQALLST